MTGLKTKIGATLGGLLIICSSSLSVTANAATEIRNQEVNVKNFRQMYYSLSVATGISTRNAELQRTFQEVKSRLPQTGSASEITTTAILAYTALAGMFCKKMILNDRDRSDQNRRAHTGVNFNGDQTQFDQTLKERLIQKYSELFLQRPASQEELSSTSITFDEVGGIETMGSASVPKVLEAACTSIAASLNGFTYQ